MPAPAACRPVAAGSLAFLIFANGPGGFRGFSGFAGSGKAAMVVPARSVTCLLRLALLHNSARASAQILSLPLPRLALARQASYLVLVPALGPQVLSALGPA